MAVTTVGAPTNINHIGGGATFSVSQPSGTTEGDVLWVILGSGQSCTFSAPDGTWTETHDNVCHDNAGASASYIHVVGASDTGPYTFSHSINDSVSGLCGAVRGARSSNPINVQSAHNTQYGTSLVCPSVTTTVDNCFVLRLGYADGYRSFTVDGATTQLGQNVIADGSDNAVVAAYEIKTTAGTTGSRTHTVSGTDQWAGITIALAPAVASDVQVPAVSCTATLFAPAPSTGAAISVPVVAAGATVYVPDVFSAVLVPSISATATLYAPEIIVGGETTIVPAVSATATAWVPAIVTGAGVVLPEIAATATAHAPFVETDSEIYVPSVAATAAVPSPVVFSGNLFIKSYRRRIKPTPRLDFQVPPYLFDLIERDSAMLPSVTWDKHPSERPRYGVDWSLYTAKWGVTIADSQWVNVTPTGGEITFSQTAETTTTTDAIFEGGSDESTEYVENRVVFSDGSSRFLTIKILVSDNIPIN